MTSRNEAAPTLTNADKILYPAQGLTKRDLANHFETVADVMLPHIRYRPLSLVRCPDGRDNECFFQKHLSKGMPDGFRPIELNEKSGDHATYFYIEDAAGLAAAAQLGALELHIWGSRIDAIEYPDRLIFDLDPHASVPFAEVRAAAEEFRDVFRTMELDAFAMLTGGKGIHVVVPLAPSRPWPEIAAFARGLAEAMAEIQPDRYVATASKQKRQGRIFIDWMRNQRGSTAIGPFSPRAREGAPVAVPVRWSEIRRIKSAGAYPIETLHRRLAALKSEPWAGYFSLDQKIGQRSFERLTGGNTTALFDS